MNGLLTFLLLAALAAGSVGAADLTDEVAQRMTATSAKQEVAANDPRVAQTRTLLDKAVKLTHEEPLAVATACSRYAGHLYDAAHIEATPLELLEVLATFGKLGQPMNETLQSYVSARKVAPMKSHAEAMAGLGKRK